MSKTKLTAMIVAGAMALAAFGGAFAFNKVSAQSSGPTTQVTPSAEVLPVDPAQPAAGQDLRGGPRGGGQQDTDLAAALGISVEQLQTAYTTANEAALKEAVSKGLITAAQAEQVTANGIPGHGLREFGAPGSANSIDFNALLASALNITPEQLQAAQQKADAARIDAAVQSGQMTAAQADMLKARQALTADAKFQASMKTAFEAGVQQAVSDGVITAAQADQIKADSAAMNFLGGHGGPDGGRGGPGGHGGHGGPDGSNAAPLAQPTN